MIKVVIVEDEILVRLGMKMCLNESKESIKVEATFANAEDAENYFENNLADVLLTDICLPGESGLELIEKLKISIPGLITVVLSCYEEFSYARKAMELGVDKYILKHELSEEELPNIIKELHEQKKKKDSEKRIFHTQKNSNIESQNLQYRIGSIILRKKEDKHNLNPEDIDFDILTEIIQETLNIRSMGECFLRHSHEIFCVLNFKKTETKEVTEKRIMDFYEDIRKSVKKYFNANLYLHISNTYTDMQKTKETYDKLKMDNRSFFYYNHSLLTFYDESKERKQIRLGLSEKYFFSSEWIEDTEKYIKEFFLTSRLEETDTEDVKNEIIKFIYELLANVKKYFNVEPEEILSDDTKLIYQYISSFDSCSCLEDFIKEIFKSLVMYIKMEKTELEKLEKYINLNYKRELTLHEAAKHFHMSTPYFCQYFKKITGITFVQYLNCLRIEKAKQLLVDDRMKIEEIAFQVGIFNSNYFLRLFKKTTGLTIGEYRNHTYKIVKKYEKSE